MCRTGNLPAAKFRSMITRADRKRIWAYADIPTWAIPYILLTLENFVAKKKDGSEYGFHFIFDKPRGTGASALWEQPKNCKIIKVFSNSGEYVTAADNPFPVSMDALIAKAGNVDWIRPEFLQQLME